MDYSYFDISDFASLYAVMKHAESNDPIWYDVRGIRDVLMGETMDIMEYVLMEEKKRLQENEEERKEYKEEINKLLDYIKAREVIEESDGGMNVSKWWWINNRETLLRSVENFYRKHLRKYYFNE